MDTKKIKEKVKKMKKAARKAGEPTPPEVSRAMMYHAETGEWPENVSSQTIELAELMIATSAAIMECV